MGQIFSANGDPGNQRNRQTKEVEVKDKGIKKDINVEDCSVLPSKDVRNEKIQQLDSKAEEKHHLFSRVPSQIQQLGSKAEEKHDLFSRVPSQIQQLGSKDEEKHDLFSRVPSQIQQLGSKDEENHDLFSRVPSQIQQVDQKDEEKPAFFQATRKYIPPFQRNEKAHEIDRKVEKPAFFQATGKHINKFQLPTMKQNPENDDAIDKVDSSTNEQIFKDGHFMNDVSVREKEILWLNHYNNGQRILLVGEGDFSFSASLAVAFGSSGANITATSFDSSDFLRDNYRNAIANIEKLTCNGATIMHRLDATKMAIHPYLRLMKFDRIIYNFPYFGFTNESPKSKIQKQKKLVRGFLSNAKEMIKQDGEIHMSHETNGLHLEWDVNELALLEGLYLVGEVNFDPADSPGDKNLDCNPSKTYMWRIVSTGFLR